MNRGDIKLAYDRAIAHDVPDVADRLYEMAERISALEAHNAVLREALIYAHDEAKSLFEESYGEDYNALIINKAIASTPESSLAEFRRAERERCAKVCDEQANEWDSDAVVTFKNYAGYCAEAIRQMED